MNSLVRRPHLSSTAHRRNKTLVNKQLNDKERVAAALENPALLKVVNGCLSSAGLRGAELIPA